MTRESLNISLTEPLRKAQVRQRLDALADHTGLSPTQIAGRALTLGLEVIEADIVRLFPGNASQSSTVPTAAASITASQSTAQQGSAQDSEAQPCAAMQSADTQRATAASPPQPEPAQPGDASPCVVSTPEAARALGYRDVSAFFKHSGRHPELMKLSKRQGRVRLWDLDKLRAEYQRQGWQPK